MCTTANDSKLLARQHIWIPFNKKRRDNQQSPVTAEDIADRRPE
jgi:hypothetical protein